MKSTTKVLVLGAIVLALNGCSKPTDAVIPTDPSQWGGGQFANQVKSLSEQDKALLMTYLMRHKLGEAFGGKQIPIGTTVGQALDEQKNWAQQQAAEEAAQQQLKRQMDEQKAAAAAQLGKTITLAFLGERYSPADYSNGKYDNEFVVDIGVKNAGDKAIKGVRAELTLKNTFGDVISTTRLNIEDTVDPGQTYHWTGSRRLNQFDDEDKKLMNLQDGQFTADLRPTMVVYADGTKVGAD